MGSGKFSRMAANTVLWLLVLLGLFGLVIIVPAMAFELASEFSQYQSDVFVLTLLLGTPVLIGVLILGLILILLRRVSRDQMLAPTSYRWIRALVVSTAALAASFATIGVWLTMKNTLPPVILIVLSVLVLISLAVSLVTHALFGLLRKAVSQSEELNEVI